MVQNDNHETGGVFVDLDVVTEQCANVKTVCIQGSEPSNKYDGEVWIDTSEDPPVMKVYDLTNTAWITRRRTEYEAVTILGGETNREPIENDSQVNGMLIPQYDGGKTVLWARSNSKWYGAVSA